MRLFLNCDDWIGLAVFRPVSPGCSTIGQGGGKRRLMTFAASSHLPPEPQRRSKPKHNADLTWIATLEIAMPNPVISMLDDDSSECERTMDLLNSMGFISKTPPSDSLPPHYTVS